MPTAEAAAVVDDYFARLATTAAAIGAAIGPDDLAELHAHVSDRLAATPGTASDAVGVLAELGSPEELAHAFAEAAPGGAAGTGPERSGSGAGRLLGVPYDVRALSSDRVATRVWDPTNPKILVPKALGVGWTINFGALAVRAHLIRPDDEDAPFAAVPERAVTATLAAPVAAVVVLAAVVAATWSSLPARVPTHWGAAGHADGYGSRGGAILALVALGVVPVLLAAVVHLRRRSRFNRVAASAASLGFAALSVMILVQTAFTVDGGDGVWPTWIGIGCFFGLPFLLLVGASRLGRAAEQRRDLPSSNLPSSKGRAR